MGLTKGNIYSSTCKKIRTLQRCNAQVPIRLSPTPHEKQLYTRNMQVTIILICFTKSNHTLQCTSTNKTELLHRKQQNILYNVLVTGMLIRLTKSNHTLQRASSNKTEVASPKAPIRMAQVTRILNCLTKSTYIYAATCE